MAERLPLLVESHAKGHVFSRRKNQFSFFFFFRFFIPRQGYFFSGQGYLLQSDSFFFVTTYNLGCLCTPATAENTHSITETEKEYIYLKS